MSKLSITEMVVTDSLYLNAEKVAENKWIIRLSNGAEIPVEKDPVDKKGVKWGLKIGGQLFDVDDARHDEWARRYLEQLIAEKLTGVRVIYHAKGKPSIICGNGCDCKKRRFGYNSAACSRCPISEQIDAERDGVKLVYAV